MRAWIGVLICAVPLVAGAESAPLLGEVHRGANLYRLHCAACHGSTGQGDGVMAASMQPKPGPVRSAALLIARTDADLHALIHDGGPALQKSETMPAFGKALTELELWDLIAFLRSGEPSVLDFFPAGARYLVKPYALDSFAQERLAKVGIVVAKDEALEVVTVFSGDRAPGTPAKLEPQDPVTLDSLKPKERMGYVVFLSAELAGEKAPVPLALGIDRDGKLTKIVALGAPGAAREKLLAGYVGQGKKGAHLPLETKTAKQAKKTKTPPVEPKLSGFDAAYARAMEAVTMYDKEERDRTWADAPAK
jgi:cytochrome c oxidase cbb3-type subunit 3